MAVFDDTIASNKTAADALLERIQKRVLWLSVMIVHHANNIRANRDGTKVGGHQASSASVVTILTSLYFEYMRAGDKISIKPHASPVFHAIQYLLGNLDRRFLTTHRAFHGLQAYPSRTKDPDHVDFSSGSVGLGAVATNFAAMVDTYNQTHGYADPAESGRFISLVGDAELDEGSVWEAIAEPVMSDLKNVLWIVDLNRQSLDRIIPGIRVRCWREMFAANGWQIIDAKYGRKLTEAFEQPNGELLRNCIDGLSNETYQRLLRLSSQDLREWLPRKSQFPADLRRLIDRWNDNELHELFWNLGGHDFEELRASYSKVQSYAGPSIIFAYTLKGWSLPSVGHPFNHSVLLTAEQMEELRLNLEISDEEIWDGFETEGPEGQFLRKVKARLNQTKRHDSSPLSISIPHQLGLAHRGSRNTQQTFGLILTALSREVPDVSDRTVTLSPDVASSTNLGGWINKKEVWRRREREALPEEKEDQILHWRESSHGQHIELGISENNLFMALGQFGLSHENFGETLFPIGTLYDPFLRRGLDALFYSISSGARFITIGTPSGVTLSSEGGSHQSLLTSSIGVELPEIAFYEPCFGQELEWIMLDALEQIRLRTRSTYLRLTTKTVDQGLFRTPDSEEAAETLRGQVLKGAYRLVDRSERSGYQPEKNVVNLFSCGAMIPEAIETGDLLENDGLYLNIINVTGPGPLFEQFQALVNGTFSGEANTETFLDDVLSKEEKKAPIVAVVDGHPHSLAWLGSALQTRILTLGITDFGQSGDRSDIYREHRIDVDSIASACRRAVGICRA